MAVLFFVLIFKLQACSLLEVFINHKGKEYAQDDVAEAGSVESIYPVSFPFCLSRALWMESLLYDAAVKNTKTNRTIDFLSIQKRLKQHLRAIEHK